MKVRGGDSDKGTERRIAVLELLPLISPKAVVEVAITSEVKNKKQNANMTSQDDVNSWLNLLSQLKSARDSISSKGLPWKYLPNLDVGLDEAKNQWIAQCARFQIQSELSAVAWIRSGVVPDEPHDQIRFFLFARFDAAIDLIERITFYQNQKLTALVPYPIGDEKEFQLELLVHWWDRAGQLFWFELICWTYFSSDNSN